MRPTLGGDVRLVVVDPYVVLRRYDRTTDTVFVLRVLHDRRRLALDATRSPSMRVAQRRPAA